MHTHAHQAHCWCCWSSISVRPIHRSTKYTSAHQAHRWCCWSRISDRALTQEHLCIHMPTKLTVGAVGLVLVAGLSSKRAKTYTCPPSVPLV
jgi:hypothetical protein